MTSVLPRGGNLALTSALASSRGKLRLMLEWGGDSPAHPAVEPVAFLLTGAGRVRSDSDMLSEAHPIAADRALSFHKSHIEAERIRQFFEIDLSKLDPALERISFCLAIHPVIGGVASIGQLTSVSCAVDVEKTEVVRSDLTTPSSTDSAFIVAEIYRRNGEWKFKAIGQGYAAGLAKLAESYGITLADEAQAVGGIVKPNSAPTAQPTTPPYVTIERPHQGFGDVQVHLTWSVPKVSPAEAPAAPKKGLLSGLVRGGSGAVPHARLDLDLCALYELSDGYRGVVQALGGNLGSYNAAPFLQLMGDSREGNAEGAATEILRINGNRWDEVRRILIYAMIFEGVPNWAKALGRATIKVPDQLPVGIKLDQNVNNMRVCSIALLENRHGKMAIHKRVETFKNPRELDEAYQWALQWKAGIKD